ncbi:murein biosynthesis integral membrane protein MurJ [Rickettsia endosymbiont of Oedothorax gibbosus]|uniref:murein biosynthesis integral membrane protein MurJ n=1 Tax=Rickettsia endosymbiont of Oedothorax gibbosus TaxID=931099 RepID=UPI002024B6B2|nr:murein biosynthesis integral membrane protein MurJ [Rickettsia endosymbiont of Oedothorax gibbosus]
MKGEGYTLFRSGIIIALFTLISRISGLARELFVASLFGAGSVADSVNVAFKLPNLFRRIFGEGALSVVFVPIFNTKIIESREAARHFTGVIFTILLITLVMVVVLMQLMMPSLMFIIAPGFHEDPEKFNLTIALCRITMPYLVFISIAAMLGGILNSVKRFAAFAFSPIILNILVIITTVALQERISAPISISLSLVIAGLLQIIFMFYCVIRVGLSFPLVFDPYNRDVKKFLSNMGPAVVSSGFQQLSLFISQSIASFIEGAISILSYADRIYQFPLSIIGVTFGTILLPELSKTYQMNDLEKAAKIQNNAIKVGLLLSLPATFGIIVLSEPIIHIIYQRGAFTYADTIKTAEAISAFALGLPAFILAKILTPIFYANHDTKTPLKITLYSLTVNTILNIIMMRQFGHLGIALACSITAWYNVWLLYVHTKKYGLSFIDAKLYSFCIYTFCGKILLSCVIMTLVIWVIKHYYAQYYYAEFLLVKAFMLAATIIVGVATFFLMVFCFKLYPKKCINDEN